MPRERWSSATGFVLVSIGSAVGIGNIWRFPYIMGVNGGGAFLLPYFIAIFVVALTILMVEFAIGRHYRKSVIGALSAISPSLRYAGVIIVFVVVMILSYYWVIMGWVLAFFAFFAAGAPVAFSDFSSSYLPLPFFGIAAALTLGVVRLGVRKGLERLSKLLIPVLFVMMLILVTYSLALPGADQGLSFYLQPNFGRLVDPSVWTAAFGQAFFSLGVGMGVMLTYGSYAGKESIAKSSAVIAVSDTSISLLAGMMIFPIVFSFGLDPAAGVQLAFVTLPSVFGQIGYGYILGAAFFLLLFFAAFTSAVSMLEVPVATIMEAYRMDRRKASALSSALIFILGIPAALSYTQLSSSIWGLPILDIYDTAFGTMSIIVAGLILTIIAGWRLDKSVLPKELGGGCITQNALRVLIRYAIPLILTGTLIARLIQLF
jgi:NSS family neurotransmitter:Na+ symporter